jgi:hypothetical protein
MSRRPTGMLPFAIEVTDDDAAVTAYAGLPLVVETMRMLGVSEQLDTQLGIRQRNGGATDAQKAEALVLLMAAGGTSLSDITKLHADKGLVTRGSRNTSPRCSGVARPSAARLWRIAAAERRTMRISAWGRPWRDRTDPDRRAKGELVRYHRACTASGRPWPRSPRGSPPPAPVVRRARPSTRS